MRTDSAVSHKLLMHSSVSRPIHRCQHSPTTGRSRRPRLKCKTASSQQGSLGQNFLVDDNIQRKIVDALGASDVDEVLEIGPGKGALTRHLAGTVRRLTLVELDDILAANLQKRFAERPDVRVLHDDVLNVDLGGLFDDLGDVLVIGNIPYNITTPIIFRLLQRPRPRDVVLMVKRRSLNE